MAPDDAPPAPPATAAALRETTLHTVSIALTGSGGSGVMTAGQMLLDAAAKAGWYGIMGRSSGPQIRGGEAAAFVRLSPRRLRAPNNVFDLMIAFDWMNVERFAAEIPLNETSLVLGEESAGPPPPVIAGSGARLETIALNTLAREIRGGRPNMIALGVALALIGLPEHLVVTILDKALKKKGEAALMASMNGIRQGIEAARALGVVFRLEGDGTPPANERWNISGNEAAGLGAVRAGVKFCAAYPITPATEILEWLAPNLEKVDGALVQAEDELASINMCIGASFGGVPSVTATAGPGLSLMMESLGLAVAAEIPLVVIDVMRGGPSTGIPVKSEQSDLNIALYGLHGDAPHIVTAPHGIADCLFTVQWTVSLAEALQCPAIVLSDQSLGQSRAVVDKPENPGFTARRDTIGPGARDYKRYLDTASGVSPMAIPGTPGGEYVADGLEHSESGRPSSDSEDHRRQLDKRQRKLAQYDYGEHWAFIEGEGDIAILTWGSPTGTCREAAARARADGKAAVRVISIRLLMPVQTEAFAAAIEGVTRVLVVEQSHSQQFYRYLRAHYDLPRPVKVFAQPGPLPIRPNQIYAQLVDW